MTASIAPLLAAVRKACLPGPWTLGVKLAREGAVLGGQTHGDSHVARVRTPGKIAPTVTLYPDDGEWSCDCGSAVDPCAHVVAAVIAATQPRQDEKTAAEGIARLRYRLRRKDGVLSLERYLVRPDGGEEPLRMSLGAPAAQKLANGSLQPTHEDMAIDRIVGARQHGWFPSDRTADIFKCTFGGRGR